ncbi:MAG: DUF4190 domain-containing protein [Ktedonobacteraceae bacterium]|nr:DUF4190 domain-containing protein [Ktedonobacteraceae bacterium]
MNPYNNPYENQPYTSYQPDPSAQSQGYYPPPEPFQPQQPPYQQPLYTPASGYAPYGQQQYMQYQPQPEEPGSTPALLGFIFSLVGLVFPIMLIPGVILSIVGLRSRSRHGMAVAGLAVSLIFIAIYALCLMFYGVAIFAAMAGG